MNSREAFENWISQYRINPDLTKRLVEYQRSDIQRCWESWTSAYNWFKAYTNIHEPHNIPDPEYPDLQGSEDSGDNFVQKEMYRCIEKFFQQHDKTSPGYGGGTQFTRKPRLKKTVENLAIWKEVYKLFKECELF